MLIILYRLRLLEVLPLEARLCHLHPDWLRYIGQNDLVLCLVSLFYLLLVKQYPKSSSFQPVTLELGGKSPIVVFEDVDLDKGLI